MLIHAAAYYDLFFDRNEKGEGFFFMFYWLTFAQYQHRRPSHKYWQVLYSPTFLVLHIDYVFF